MAEQVMAELAEELKRRYEALRGRDPPPRRPRRDRRAQRRDRRLGAAPRRTRSPRARTRSTRSRSACRSGRKRCTRAARSGSAAGHRSRAGYPEADERSRAHAVDRTTPAADERLERRRAVPLGADARLRADPAAVGAPLDAPKDLGADRGGRRAHRQVRRLHLQAEVLHRRRLDVVSVGAYALARRLVVRRRPRPADLRPRARPRARARRQGVPASAPLFIPFMGAVVGMKQMPENAWKEAQVALAGPLLGTLGAAAVWGARRRATTRNFLKALAFIGFLINSSTCSGRAARRRPRGGRAPPGSVGGRPRRTDRARDLPAEPDPDHHPRLRRPRAVAPLEDARPPGVPALLRVLPWQRSRSSRSTSASPRSSCSRCTRRTSRVASERGRPPAPRVAHRRHRARRRRGSPTSSAQASSGRADRPAGGRAVRLGPRQRGASRLRGGARGGAAVRRARLGGRSPAAAAA